MREIEKAQKEAYANAEIQFKSLEAQAFVKYDSEKQELYQKIQSLETINTDFDKIMTKQQLLFVLTKLGMVAQLHKVLRRIRDSDKSMGVEP